MPRELQLWSHGSLSECTGDETDSTTHVKSPLTLRWPVAEVLCAYFHHDNRQTWLRIRAIPLHQTVSILPSHYNGTSMWPRAFTP